MQGKNRICMRSAHKSPQIWYNRANYKHTLKEVLYMKALILAAGFGRRLQPITNTMPKSMVKVNGTPLLCNALNNVTACGITEIGIVVGHMADYIKENIGDEWNGLPVR